MATFRKKDDPLVSCPYNPAHRMLRSRLQMHLTKCVKDHPDADKRTCPFNAKHRISAAEFSHHLVQCPDKGLVERKIAYESNDVHRGNTQVPAYMHEEVPPSQETGFWDDEAEEDPYKYKPKSNPLFKDPMILSTWKPAERRRHYQSLGKRNSDEEADEPIENFQPAVRKNQLKELRQPKMKPEDFVWSKKEEPWQNTYAAGASSGLGRGYPMSTIPNRRIAANIFGHTALDASLYSGNISSGLGNLSLGRGRGVLGAATNGVGISDYPPVPPGQVSNINSNQFQPFEN